MSPARRTPAHSFADDVARLRCGRRCGGRGSFPKLLEITQVVVASTWTGFRADLHLAAGVGRVRNLVSERPASPAGLVCRRSAPPKATLRDRAQGEPSAGGGCEAHGRADGRGGARGAASALEAGCTRGATWPAAVRGGAEGRGARDLRPGSAAVSPVGNWGAGRAAARGPVIRGRCCRPRQLRRCFVEAAGAEAGRVESRSRLSRAVGQCPGPGKIAGRARQRPTAADAPADEPRPSAALMFPLALA